VLVEPVRETLATGRLAALRARVQGDYGRLADATVSLGELSGIVVELDGEERELLLLAPISIEEERPELELRLEGRLEGGVPFVTTHRVPIEAAAYQESELKVSRRYVEPAKADQERAATERARLREVLTRVSGERLWRGGFERPTRSRATSPFGTKRVLNGKQQSRHLGWDLDGKIGDPIVAAARGRVVLVDDLFYSGGTVILDHGQGLFTLYFHLSAFDVTAGGLVDKGQLLGKVGQSGRVTGPHLHFGLKLADTYVDPKHALSFALVDAVPRVLEAEAVSP
jgi:murein DD-endopeptidase MepM/ murein hydrolase activator NlpD